MIQVLIAEDNDELSQALTALLEGEADLQVVGRVALASDVVPAVRLHRPDVLLLDLWFPDGDAVGAIPEIAVDSPGTSTIVLSCHDVPLLLRAARAAGAADYLVKGSDLTEMLDRIRSCATPAVSPQPPPAG